MICKDCIHSEPCRTACFAFCGFDDIDVEKKCRHFKDKNKIIELPDKIYQPVKDKVYEGDITRVIFDTTLGFAFDKNSIGKSLFLSKEEAENKLRG